MSFLTRKPEEKPVAGPETVATSVSLSELYDMLADSQKQLAGYLLRRESQSAGAPVAGVDGKVSISIAPVIERLDAIGELLGDSLSKEIFQRFDRLEALMKSLPKSEGQVVSQVAQTAQVEAPKSEPAPVPVVAPAPAPVVSSRPAVDFYAQFELAVFGHALVENDSIRSERQYILEGLFANDPICSFLAGILIMFQSSPPEKMALLLKDLGEAFYRWANAMRGNFENFENLLAQWAQWMCENAGLQNAIEIVHVGQRFDSTRHNATSRGVEITHVNGWVVLRGNGSVYAKASVDVQ